MRDYDINFIRCVCKGVWLACIRNDEDAIALHHGTGMAEFI